MRSRMASAGLLALAFACGSSACGSAFAQPADASGQLGVGVTVRPSRPATQALASLPLPPGSQALSDTPFGGSYHYPGTVPDAVEFFRTAMHGNGYRLVGQQQHPDRTRLLWERGAERVELDCRAVLGATAATRIIVVASVMREG
jgi:hypothetical protein